MYSGRRGIHCWISDQHALDLTDDQRKALVTFLEVIKGGKEQVKKVNVRGSKGDAELHPFLTYVSVFDLCAMGSRSRIHRADIVREAVDSLGSEFALLCLRVQNCFGQEKGWETLLSLLPAERRTCPI